MVWARQLPRRVHYLHYLQPTCHQRGQTLCHQDIWRDDQMRLSRAEISIFRTWVGRLATLRFALVEILHN